ncbi:MAG: hypothetical protein V1894_05825, partial [Chloroflexota bacterium]
DTAPVALKLASPKAGATDVLVKPVFQWDAVTGATAYELVVARDVNFTDTAIVKAGDYALPTTAWECNVSLNYGTTYYWKVRGTSPTSHSDWSAVSAFTTESAPPPTIIPPPPTPPAPAAAPSFQTATLLPTSTPKSLAEPPPAPLPPLPPSPAPAVQVLPNWAIYLLGALLFIIVLLLVIILTMVIVMRRD